MLLALSDIRQQSAHDCGEAATRVILAHQNITAAVRLATPQHGTDPTQIESALRRIGLLVTAGEMSIEDLRHYCDDSRPVIALVHWPTWEDSHFVCVRGVSRGRVYYHDVSDGPGKCSVNDWLAAWSAEGRVGTFRRWGIVAWPETRHP